MMAIELELEGDMTLGCSPVCASEGEGELGIGL